MVKNIPSISRRFIRELINSKNHRLALSAAILFLACFETSHSGLTEGSHVAYKNKRISMLGDGHIAGTELENKAQTQNLVDLFKEMSAANTEGLHILLEKAGTIIKDSSALRNLIEILGKSPLNRIAIEDSEIRKIANSAENMFKQIFPKFSLSEDEHFFAESLSYGEISVNSIIQEYNKHLAGAERFRAGKDQELNFSVYDRILDESKTAFLGLQKLFDKVGVRDNDKILTLCRKLWTEDHTQRKVFAAAISDVFAPLFDMHLFKRLIECPNNNITIVAGGRHVQQVRDMLLDQGAEVLIYHIGSNDLLSKSQLRGLLTGYSLTFFIKETISTGLIRVLLFIVDIRSLIEPVEPKK